MCAHGHGRAVLEAVLERAGNRSLLWVNHRPAELAQFPQVCRLEAGPGWQRARS